MNNADTALAAGFDALLSEAGDVITFRGGSVSAVIDWMPVDERPPGRGIPDYDTKATSRIEIRSGSVLYAPKVGEIVTTGGGVYHRIQEVRFNGSAWVLDCEVTV